MGYREGIIDFILAKSEVPAEFVLGRRGIGLDIPSAKFVDEPFGQIVAEAGVIQEIIPPLGRVKGGALESRDCADSCHMLLQCSRSSGPDNKRD